ncbi:hypothetical protein [Amycolatopsis sp. GM8]|uniref:DUF7144 family membrane protein n=1 Tax=Amycolatopsis sp. GM8 TaxID=2896530 RepID=UPI001F23897D|nr:hypothetical protein [Amycolatopsis sp. GM8]
MTERLATEKGTGWVAFAGVVAVLIGVFNAVVGTVALLEGSYYVSTRQGPLLFDLTVWGWLHIGAGLLIGAAGLALFFGAGWARVVIVLLAGFNALAQLAFVSAAPVWGTLVIALDVLVIWAVMTHGNEPAS